MKHHQISEILIDYSVLQPVGSANGYLHWHLAFYEPMSPLYLIFSSFLDLFVISELFTFWNQYPEIWSHFLDRRVSSCNKLLTFSHQGMPVLQRGSHPKPRDSNQHHGQCPEQSQPVACGYCKCFRLSAFEWCSRENMISNSNDDENMYVWT